MKPYKRHRLPPDNPKGIPRGCPLSPLLGALFLAELDNTLEQQDVFYVRYRDDVLIMKGALGATQGHKTAKRNLQPQGAKTSEKNTDQCIGKMAPAL
jgi:hypothetical protein